MKIFDVSIIIPCYQAADTILRAIESARASEGVTVQVIVVDDASTDDSVDRVKSLASPDVILFQQDKNYGPSECRNRAIELATGTWIAVLDADDWFSPERLSTLLRYAEAHKLDIIGDAQAVVSADGAVVRERLKGVFAKCRPLADGLGLVDVESLIRNREIGICQPVIRREFWLNCNARYRSEFRYGEDYHLLFDLVFHGARFGIYDHAMYFAELSESSLTADRVKMFSGFIQVLSSIQRILRSAGQLALVDELDQAIRDAKHTVAYGTVVDPLKAGKPLLAIRNAITNPRFFAQLPSRILSRLAHRGF